MSQPMDNNAAASITDDGDKQLLEHLTGIWEIHNHQKSNIKALQGEKENLAKENEAQREEIKSLQTEKDKWQKESQKQREQIQSLQLEKGNWQTESQKQREQIQSLRNQIRDLTTSKVAFNTHEDADLYSEGPGGIYDPSSRQISESSGLETFNYSYIQERKAQLWKADIQTLYDLRKVEYPLGDKARAIELEIFKLWATLYTRHDILDILVLKQVDIANLEKQAKLASSAAETEKLEMKASIVNLTEERNKINGQRNNLHRSLNENSELLKTSKAKMKGLTEAIGKRDEEIANYKRKLRQVETDNQPIREMAFALLDRTREQDKPIDERDEAIIDRGNAAAHGGNILAAIQRYTNSNDEDKEWFHYNYGFRLHTFSLIMRSPIVEEIANMRFQMRHNSKTIPDYFGTEFERIFQEVRAQVEDWQEEEIVERTTERLSEVMEENFLEDEDVMDKIKVLRKEYELASTKEKSARQKEW
ncbi:hypothetical protein NHQ30_005564 [Ciborinia camelliae]|nr:hypothetical protein NHQ30_005564 [Ciborinia camelliae]